MKSETYAILCHIWMVGFVLHHPDPYRYLLFAVAFYLGVLGVRAAWREGETYLVEQTGND